MAHSGKVGHQLVMLFGYYRRWMYPEEVSLWGWGWAAYSSGLLSAVSLLPVCPQVRPLPLHTLPPQKAVACTKPSLFRKSEFVEYLELQEQFEETAEAERPP